MPVLASHDTDGIIIIIIYYYIQLDIAQYLQHFYCALHQSTHLKYIKILCYLHNNVK